MVALTRSPRETRFLFHARDTALLYAQDMGFFPEDASIREAWKNTVDVQRFHENNQEARWDNALRYALSIMLGVRGHQINNRKPGNMVRAATEVLLRSSSENGLFPGKLDIVTKGPLDGVFDRERDADSCYEASFEIPYIFLIHAAAIGAIVDVPSEPEVETAPEDAHFSRHPLVTVQSPNSTIGMPAHHTTTPQVQIDQREERELRKLVAKLSDVLYLLPYLPKSTSSSDCTRSEELAGDARLTLKKSMPLSNIIDSHSIVEIEDEWLFKYPDFFGFEVDDHISIDDTLDLLKNSDATWLKNIDVAEMRRKYSSLDREDYRADDQSIVPCHDSSSASTYYHSSISGESSIVRGGPGDSGLAVQDIPSRKRLRRKVLKDFVDVALGSFEYIWKHISEPRTVAKAKKRAIIWARRGTDLGQEAALLCYSASKGNEKANMLEFFERHFRYENFIFDHCNLAYNTWETEVHLSFFTLGDASGPLSSEAPLNVEGFPGVQGEHIFRGSIGMRFHGDAFDRYWTLHMFASVDPKELPDKIDTLGTLGTFRDETYYFQRKVLELHIITGMLDQVASRTQQILAKVKAEMGIKSGAFSWSIPSMDTYSSWRRLWEGFAPLLQALADDLISAQDIIGQWETREGGRGQERPRWTRNDEKKYRAAITRCQRALNWRKKGIQDALNDVESLREACTARLANAREELSFRSSQNIASFTYVTIVFLPLGFAASVFGMNGYPDAGWVASMTVIAVVTLAITATALANAKLLLGVAEQFSKDALRFTGAVFQSSLIGQQQQRRRDERAQASPVPNMPSNGKSKGGEPLNGRTARHVLFWMAYLLIELPARRVALACRALPASLMQAVGLLRLDAKPAATVTSTDGPSGPPAAFISRKIIRVAGGILLLPLLLISWTIQLLFYNVLDILICLGGLIRKTFYALVTLSDANGSATDAKIVTWLIDPLPSLRPVRKFMSHDEKSEKSSEQADTSVASERSDSSLHEEV
ncbi:hypothetical protein Daus18300_010587 [Diaporthe australafricana]|uniref:Uncharacterized protein n=1 Tax=Diaporthe australafricana TaxID=127596 RepID=A0ABR3W9Q7_9PEZI